MYDSEAVNQCSSECMTIVSSYLQGNSISIRYEQMLMACVKGSLVEIKCKYFKNPVWQDKWYGFSVKILDDQSPSGVIEQSGDIALDAQKFKPQIIGSRNFQV